MECDTKMENGMGEGYEKMEAERGRRRVRKIKRRKGKC